MEDNNRPDITNAIELIDNQFSASSRLQGIALVNNLPDYDTKIIDLLSEKAISDENTNVRLAAVFSFGKTKTKSDYNREKFNKFLFSKMILWYRKS